LDTAQVEKLFGGIHVWTRGDERAPHKPLLLLYALGRCSRNEPRLVPYADVDRDLRALLVQFGPRRKSQHTEYPFWRLRNDSLWELHGAELVQPRASNNDAKKSELLKHRVEGGFPEPIFAALRANPRLLGAVAQGLLDDSFPPSMHEDILSAVGLDLPLGVVVRSPRDPAFRSRILTAYEYRCAVCGFDVRLGSVSLGIEAAHIKWHQAGGPDVEANGFALCALHHKLFDRGAFTVSASGRVELSEQLHGGTGFRELLLAHHGQPVRPPPNPNHRPAAQFLAWHHKEVFQGPARYREPAPE
jgi:putative restriction endonuclease